ncbi:hypothetical protein T484DRAFT_1792792 [Baffinella frigidus]|nr:hypothetical protein T484DRAFT_1792792 [Cryptophyta sp. CCMP2293]
MFIFVVFNVQSKQYFEWQLRYNIFWHKQSGQSGPSRYNIFWHKQSGQSGPVTRLLSMGGAWPTDATPHPKGDHLMNEVRTHIAPEYDYSIDSYVAYNKPLAITHWLQTAKVTEDVIIVIDPDCALISPITSPVVEGKPQANQRNYSFQGYSFHIAQHYCKGICKHFDPIAVPVVVHRKIAQHYCVGICKHFDPIAFPVIVHRNVLDPQPST